MYSKDRKWIVGIAAFLAAMILLSILFGAATCSDGWASPSIGRRGACSSHGGVDRTMGVVKLLLSLGSAFGAVMMYGSRREKWLLKDRAGQGTSAAIPASATEPVSGYIQSRSAQQQAASPHQRTRPAKPPSKVKCPICGGGMALRTARVGKNAGSQFWGCKRFPKCKGTKTHHPDFCR